MFFVDPYSETPGINSTYRRATSDAVDLQLELVDLTVQRGEPVGRATGISRLGPTIGARDRR